MPTELSGGQLGRRARLDEVEQDPPTDDECCQEVKLKGCDVLRAARQLSYTYECEPPQVEQYCLRIWRPKLTDLVEIARFRKPFALSGRVFSQPLSAAAASNRGLGTRLPEIVGTTGQTAVLGIKGVEATADPGAVWAASDASALQVVFVPVSEVEIQGRSQPAQVRADLKVAEMSIVIDVAMEQPPKDEQDQHLSAHEMSGLMSTYSHQWSRFRRLYLTRRNVVRGIEPSCRGATLHESSSPFSSY
jgi:hypothetical protein